MGKKQVSEIELVQAIPGCIQLRPSDTTSSLWLSTLGQQILYQKGVCVVQPDETSGNMIIIFDPRIVTLPSMLNVLQQWGVSGVSTPTMPTNMQVGNFLYEHPKVDALLPTIIGMIAVEVFKLRGGWAMLLNLAASVVTRQLLDQVEQASLSVPETPSFTPSYTPEIVSDSVEVVHSLPGRLRLRVLRLLSFPDEGSELQQLLSADASVTDVRINYDAASVTVTYNATNDSAQAVSDRLIALITNLNTPESETEAKPKPTTEPKIHSNGVALLSQPEREEELDPLFHLKPFFAYEFYRLILKKAGFAI